MHNINKQRCLIDVCIQHNANQLPNKFIIINELLIDYIWIKNLELVEDHHVVHEIIIIYNV